MVNQDLLWRVIDTLEALAVELRKETSEGSSTEAPWVEWNVFLDDLSALPTPEDLPDGCYVDVKTNIGDIHTNQYFSRTNRKGPAGLTHWKGFGYHRIHAYRMSADQNPAEYAPVLNHGAKHTPLSNKESMADNTWEYQQRQRFERQHSQTIYAPVPPAFIPAYLADPLIIHFYHRYGNLPNHDVMPKGVYDAFKAANPLIVGYRRDTTKEPK